jgi:hypothetical protein
MELRVIWEMPVDIKIGLRFFLLFALGTLFPADVWAHVKWFSPYDLSKPPLPVGEVLTPTFIYLYLISIVTMYGFFWVDRYLFRKQFLVSQLEKYSINDEQSFWILRISIFIFFVSLFLLAFNGPGFLLTPELITKNPVVKYLQLAMACLVLLRRTTPLVGVGIFILYGLGIEQYGIFHMLDYLIFLGVGLYFLLSGLKDQKWVKIRYIVLFASTGLTLLWASIEKWGYPSWSYPLLQNDASLLMGLSPQFYMVFAGFVEFNITFVLISSASSVSRIIAAIFQSVFILAIVKFGLVDAIGHLLIIAILFILAVRGPTSARIFLVLSDKSLWTEAYFMTGLYILAFNVIFIAFYGLYFLTH